MSIVNANNATSTLNGAITATATQCTLASGTGALFPALVSGQSFRMTFVSAQNPTIREIVNVTAINGDNITAMTRAAEGTTARAWLAGDVAANLITAGTLNSYLQGDGAQSGLYSHVTAGGTANAITGVVPSTLTALPDGMPIAFSATAANTTSVTFDLTLFTTDTGAKPVVKYGNMPLVAGDIPTAGYPVQLEYSVAYGAWVLINPAPASATETRAGISRFATSTEAQALTSTAIAISPGELGTVVASATQLGLAKLATAAQAVSAATGVVLTPAVLASAASSVDLQTIFIAGYQIKFGEVAPQAVGKSTTNTVTVTFTNPFPTNALIVLVGAVNPGGGASGTSSGYQDGSLTKSQFIVQLVNNDNNATISFGATWIAIGN